MWRCAQKRVHSATFIRSEPAACGTAAAAYGRCCVREVLLRGCRVRGSRVSRVANVTQNAGALLASVRPLV